MGLTDIAEQCARVSDAVSLALLVRYARAGQTKGLELEVLITLALIALKAPGNKVPRRVSTNFRNAARRVSRVPGIIQFGYWPT